MSILDIRVLGDPILRKATTPVTKITADTHRLIEDMFETMYLAGGIGLAAPQVGRGERITVVHVDEHKFVLINPEIVEQSGNDRSEEGCLSIPDIYGDVDRSLTVTVRALDENGQARDITASGLLARCMLHEIDHLDGKLFIDYLSPLKRRSVMSKWKKIQPDYPGFIRKVTAESRDETRPSGSRTSEGVEHHDTEM
ncbi:MAG: peptide deformylase [Gemmatimonadota bacterium]|nr:peptide deformylase [Gemmatimonadota bacterium]